MMSFGRITQLCVQSGANVVRSNNIRNFSSLSSVLNQKKEEWPKEKYEWKLPKEEWSSFFHYFAPEKGITADFVHKLQQPIDLSPKAIKRWYTNFKKTKEIFDQSYNEERVTAVGCELAAAHFIVFRGGKVRQKGSSEWIKLDENDEYDLPRFFTPGYFVESIDASNTALRYEGLECIGNLEYLKWLDVSNCTHMDDWCIDRICGQYASTLEYLNVSNCTRITERGIAALSRLRVLKTLDLTGLHNIKDIELLCLLLEDVNPNIKIIGVDYMNFPKAHSKEK